MMGSTRVVGVVVVLEIGNGSGARLWSVCAGCQAPDYISGVQHALTLQRPMLDLIHTIVLVLDGQVLHHVEIRELTVSLELLTGPGVKLRALHIDLFDASVCSAGVDPPYHHGWVLSEEWRQGVLLPQDCGGVVEGGEAVGSLQSCRRWCSQCWCV